MADGTPAGRTIRSASDEAAAKTESSQAHIIHSASDEGMLRAGRPAPSQPRNQSAQRVDGMVAQAGRDFDKPAMVPPSQRLGTGDEPTGRTVQSATRHADQNLTRAMDFGNVFAVSYGAAYSEIVKHMHGAAQRQSAMLNDMLRARRPSDLLLAGNRYLLSGLQAAFDTNARIAQASAHTADDADRKQIRRAV